MKRLLFVLLMMVCSVSSAEWEFSGTALEGNISHYYDKSTIRRNGAIAKIWVLTDYSKVQISPDGTRFKSSKGLTAYNCEEETFATISILWNSGSMGRGEVVWTGTRKENEWEWKPIAPQSTNVFMMKIACVSK
jgi:hypothetical protein